MATPLLTICKAYSSRHCIKAREESLDSLEWLYKARAIWFCDECAHFQWRRSSSDFWHHKMEFYIWIHNTVVSFPHVDILLTMADVKAYFCFSRIYADLTGSFGFLANSYYCLATATIFGSNTSASSWESFCRAIETMAQLFFHRDGPVKNHKFFLGMIQWDTRCPPGDCFVKAKKCPMHSGIFQPDGSMKSLNAMIYVDDSLVAAPCLVCVKNCWQLPSKPSLLWWEDLRSSITNVH